VIFGRDALRPAIYSGASTVTASVTRAPVLDEEVQPIHRFLRYGAPRPDADG
jgi:hypothetical protein